MPAELVHVDAEGLLQAFPDEDSRSYAFEPIAGSPAREQLVEYRDGERRCKGAVIVSAGGAWTLSIFDADMRQIVGEQSTSTRHEAVDVAVTMASHGLLDLAQG